MLTLDPIAMQPQSQLVVALRAGVDGAISITRVEALTDQISLTFNERGETSLWSMLSEEFRRFVSGIVGVYRDRPGLVFLEDLKLQIGALTLLGCKILSTRTTGERSNLILRFSYIVGDVSELFRIPSVKPSRRGPVLQKLIDLTSAFFMPLRDISLHLQARDGEGAVGDGTEKTAYFQNFFNEKLREAEFAFFLLRRDIEHLEREGELSDAQPKLYDVDKRMSG